MNRGVLLAAVVLAVGLAACPDDVRSCSRCAPIEGTYAVHFEGPAVQTECGDAGVSYPDAGTLTIGREGANLDGTFEELQLTGVLYETDDFSLESTRLIDGGVAGTTVTFAGRYVSPTAEAPARMVGSSARITATCTATRGFSATRLQ